MSELVTHEQFIQSIQALENRLMGYIKPPKQEVHKRICSTGDYVEINQDHRSSITLVIDGDGMDFDATFVALYRARQDGEFIPARLIGPDGSEAEETGSCRAFYNVMAAPGHSVRVVAKRYVSGEITVSLIGASNA